MMSVQNFRSDQASNLYTLELTWVPLCLHSCIGYYCCLLCVNLNQSFVGTSVMHVALARRFDPSSTEHGEIDRPLTSLISNGDRGESPLLMVAVKTTDLCGQSGASLPNCLSLSVPVPSCTPKLRETLPGQLPLGHEN